MEIIGAVSDTQVMYIYTRIARLKILEWLKIGQDWKILIVGYIDIYLSI